MCVLDLPSLTLANFNCAKMDFDRGAVKYPDFDSLIITRTNAN